MSETWLPPTVLVAAVLQLAQNQELAASVGIAVEPGDP